MAILCWRCSKQDAIQGISINVRCIVRATPQRTKWTKSQEPRAKSQEPRAKSQEPRAKDQEPVNICHPIAIQVPGFIDKGDITASLVPSSGRNATLTET